MRANCIKIVAYHDVHTSPMKIHYQLWNYTFNFKKAMMVLCESPFVSTSESDTTHTRFVCKQKQIHIDYIKNKMGSKMNPQIHWECAAEIMLFLYGRGCVHRFYVHCRRSCDFLLNREVSPHEKPIWTCMIINIATRGVTSLRITCVYTVWFRFRSQQNRW